jgi:RNA polymerase sigma-70 factor (ECF subfamily)
VKSTELYDRLLLEKVKKGDTNAFSLIFTAYYRDLSIFACHFTNSTDIAEEIVQDIFVLFWGNRTSLQITTSLKSYLLKTVQNRCFDWKRHQKVRDNYSEKILANSAVSENDTENYILYSELENRIEQALGELPNEYAVAFRMNRYEGLTYPEIAEKAGVSVRTIEVRMGKALQILREKLKEFLIAILPFLLHLLK